MKLNPLISFDLRYLLESLLPYERAQVADALDTITFNDGDVIIRQGDIEGDKFYIIEKGEVVCEKSSDTNGPPVESMRLGPGSYFGELALLTNQPRQVFFLLYFFTN
jgi:cAMP-dependent protein kinase regulator